MKRAVVWGGILPVLIILGALVHPAALAAVAIYPMQVARIALRRSGGASRAWTYAAFVMLAKFAELQGLLRYHASRLRGGDARIIEYK